MSSVSVSWDKDNLDKVMSKLEPTRIEGAARKGLDELVTYAEGQIGPNIPRNTGATAQALFTDVRGSGVNLTGIVGHPLAHMKVIEVGRKPGKFPPEEPIRLWAKEVLGKEDRSTVFLIRRAIARRGLWQPDGMQLFKKAAVLVGQRTGAVLKKYLDGLF